MTCRSCSAPIGPDDRFCARCGHSLGTDRDMRTHVRKAAGVDNVVSFAGPALGGLLGFVAGEALVGELSADGPEVIPVGALVVLGTLLAGPLLLWLTERTPTRRRA